MEHNPAHLYRGPIGVLLEPAVRRLRGHRLATRRIVWKLHRAVWLATKSNRVLALGHDLELDPGDALAIASGRYEPAETAWYEAHVSTGQVVIEVGANIGFFTVLLARLVGPEGHVIAYEPDPELCAILRRNVTRNGYHNVDIRQAAVADKAGELMFYQALKNTGDNRLFTHGADRAVFPVRAVCLDDDLAALHRPIDLVKMDIQGAEPLALAGMSGILAATPPRRMLIEFWPHGIVGMGNDPAQLVTRLRDCGYSVTEMAHDEAFDVEAGLRRMTPENQTWVNLTCELSSRRTNMTQDRYNAGQENRET